MTTIVYVLTNPAMPGLVKIGLTSRTNVDRRMDELQTTGVPLPFECEWALEVEEDDVGKRLERALHQAFSGHRVSANREFFELEVEDAIAVLRVFPGTDVTPQIQEETGELDPGNRADTDRFKRSRRPNLNFTLMQIPAGAMLKNRLTSEEAEVVAAKKVRFREEEMALSKATMMVRDGKYSPPQLNWTYNGRRLVDIWRETMLDPDGDD